MEDVVVGPRRFAAALAVALLLPGVGWASPGCAGTHWVGAWATSPTHADAPGFTDQTLRLVVHPTLGGRRVRIRLSNRFGAGPVTFGAAFVARRKAGAQLVSGSNRRLRFAGRSKVTIAAGAEIVSDPVVLRVRPFRDLAVSLYVRGAGGAATEHWLALQTSYASPAGSGNHARDPRATVFTDAIASWPYVTDVEVLAPRSVGAVIAVGDSITDGVPSEPGENARYPDALARRLSARRPRTLAVQNAGISGNRVLTSFLPQFGPSLLERLDRDVIDQAGARVVLLLEGTNDFGTLPTASAEALVAGLQAVVDRLHAVGIRVVLATQTPAKGFTASLHGSPEAIAARHRSNEWIRTSGVADGVVDFDAVVRDPADPDRLRPEYDSGDHLHPNAAGFAAMAAAVDPELLRAGADACPSSR